MQLNIEEQIPINTKIIRDYQIVIPVDVRKNMGWEIGDKLHLYATTKGIFIKKIETEEEV